MAASLLMYLLQIQYITTKIKRNNKLRSLSKNLSYTHISYFSYFRFDRLPV